MKVRVCFTTKEELKIYSMQRAFNLRRSLSNYIEGLIIADKKNHRKEKIDLKK